MPPTLASSSITTAGGPPALTPAPPSKLMFRLCFPVDDVSHFAGEEAYLS
ncbi:hypothetical protein F2Q68_00032678 [Brassica cretica]|uniref:Uncharacterized protein n=1 Tax=Brassica cretica TaxID=69181 RepID=A0A8S9GE41_BRACR|nr:hypothetical protein F2Q68_00032678 [Brassica cretica]